MKRYLPFIIIGAVAMLTAAAGAVLFHYKQRAVLSGHASGAGKTAMTPEHVRGDRNAPVTLEEFGDFQCPACATTAGMLRPLEEAYGSKLRMVFWNFPLPMHKHGREAALAAEAASLQGHFWEMHDLLYQNQVGWSTAEDARPSFERYASELQLDLERFKKDFASPEVAARVDRQREYGVSRGVTNTPTIFVNDREVTPPFGSQGFHQAIDGAMSAKKGP